MPLQLRELYQLAPGAGRSQRRRPQEPACFQFSDGLADEAEKAPASDKEKVMQIEFDTKAEAWIKEHRDIRYRVRFAQCSRCRHYYIPQLGHECTCEGPAEIKDPEAVKRLCCGILTQAVTDWQLVRDRPRFVFNGTSTILRGEVLTFLNSTFLNDILACFFPDYTQEQVVRAINRCERDKLRILSLPPSFSKGNRPGPKPGAKR